MEPDFVTKLEKMTDRSLKAYINAGWDEANAEELAEELASFLEGTEADTLAISPLKYKLAVQNMLERFWERVRAQLPSDPQQIEETQKKLRDFIIAHLGDITHTFAAIFQGQTPQPNELAPIIALILLYLLRRWEDYLQAQKKRASS